jgi:hypothetical protein
MSEWSNAPQDFIHAGNAVNKEDSINDLVTASRAAVYGETTGSTTLPPRSIIDDAQNRVTRPSSKSRLCGASETQGVSSPRVAGFSTHEGDPRWICTVSDRQKRQQIAEAPFGAYDQKIWHITRFECKSITAFHRLLIDVRQIYVDDRIVDIFASGSARSTVYHRNMTSPIF